MENNFTIKDTVTVFLLPFIFNEEYYHSLEKNTSIWRKIDLVANKNDLGIDKSAFYPHIYKFLVGNLSLKKGEEAVNPNHCIVYSLKENMENQPEEIKYINKLFSNTNLEIKVRRNETDRDKLNFRLLNEKSKLSSPKLILCPNSSVGLLILSLALTGDKRTLTDLLAFNNMLHKIDQPPEIQISLPENAHKLRIEEAGKIYQSLADNVNENKQSWRLYNLFKFLLSNFDKNTDKGIEPFNTSRFHLFTYFHVDSSEKFENGKQPDKNELMTDLIRIAGCQNKKYKVLPNDLYNNEKYRQTFENIYIASCVEGACMMVDSQDVDSTFFTGFKNATFLARYLWIYLLVCMQRHTLIKLTKELMNIDVKTASSKDGLGKHLKNLSEMKINSFFTDISDHTQHNDFYRFCSDKLRVKKHIEDVNEKIKDADAILSYRIEQAETKRNYILQVFMAVLTITQIFIALTAYRINIDCWLVMLIPIICLIIVIGLVLRYFIKRRTERRKI